MGNRCRDWSESGQCRCKKIARTGAFDRGRNACPRGHCRFSFIASDTTTHVRARQRNWGSRGLFRVCQSDAACGCAGREVGVIVCSSGEQLGIMKLSDALRKAQSLGLDVVEVAPTANPPVCKSVALGKFRYDISKHERDKRPTGARLKEIKFRVNIDDHDYLTKIRHGEDFIDRCNKVRVQLQFRGREMAHQEFGLQLMERVRDDLSGMSQVEMEPKITGRNITMTLTPLPANRRKRRFASAPKTDDTGEPAVSPNSSNS